MSILTKVVVFGSEVSGAESGVQIFADAIANINDDGTEKTQFYEGDSQYLLVIVPDEYRLVAVKCTDGIVTALGQVSRGQVDRVLFAEKDVAVSLAQLPAGEVSPKWYGRSATITVDKQQVTASAVPCIADITYTYAALQYRLTAPSSLAIGANDGDDWPIGVVVYVEAVA